MKLYHFKQFKNATSRVANFVILALMCFSIVSTALAAVQDGFGYSPADVIKAPLEYNISADGFSSFPAQISKGALSKFSGGVFDGTYLWLIPCNARAVVRVNTSTGAMTGYGNWPEGFAHQGNYKFRSGVFDKNGGLWLIPFHADRVVHLDTATGQMTSYSAWPQGVSGSETAKFIGGVYHNGAIYMVPAASKSVVSLDTATGQMTAYSNWPGGLAVDALKFSGGLLRGDDLWMIPLSSNQVVKMNLATGAMTGYGGFPDGIGTYDVEKFSGAVGDNLGNLWLVPNSARVLVKLSTASGVMTGYSNFPAEVPAGQANKFAGGAFDGKSIWLAPSDATALVSIDTNTGAMTAFSNFPEDYSTGAAGKSAGASFDGDSLWLVPHHANQLVRFSKAREADLTADTATRVFTPGQVEISVSGHSKLEYFRLKTNDSTAVSADNYTALYNSAPADGKSVLTGSSKLFASTNGLYWLRITMPDGSASVKNVKIDNIYTPCLKIAGYDSGRQLYNQSLSLPHGLPLEADGSLVANPGLGYMEIRVEGKAVEGYNLSGASSVQVLLDDLKYLTAPGNTVEFKYIKALTSKPEVRPPKPDTPDIPTPVEPPKPPVTPVLPEFITPILPNETPPEQTPSTPQPENSKKDGPHSAPAVEHSDPAGENLVTYTLTNIAYSDSAAGYCFKITDYPAPGMRLVSGQIPAFELGGGVTYTILCKTPGSQVNKVLAEGISAASPYKLNNPSREIWSEITLYFGNVPVGFGKGAQITYTFAAGNTKAANTYETTWDISDAAKTTPLSRLNHAAMLLQAKMEAASPEERVELAALLEHALVVINDPYASVQDIQNALAQCGEALDDTPTLESGPQKTWWQWILLIAPFIFALVSLFFSVLALLRRKRKKGE